MSDPTWISAERHTALSDLNHPSSADRMHSPQNTHKEEDGKSHCMLICVLIKGLNPLITLESQMKCMCACLQHKK
ncbi:hypothetical protein PO909_013797 [Leuciscus waleckii]